MTAIARRGTSSKNLRGNTSQWRRRRERMIAKHGVARKSDGRKTRIPCFHCGRLMRADGYKTPDGTFFSWEVDRFPICGHAQGTYADDNIVPACRDCNANRCTTAKKCRYGAADAAGDSRRIVVRRSPR